MPTGQKLPKRKTYRSGPWLGVYDSINAPIARGEYLLDGLNLWPDPAIAPAWGGRPGWRRIDDSITGVSSGTVGQGLFTYIAADTHYPFVVVSGKIFTVAGSGATTDVTPAAVVALSNSAHRIYGTQYDNTLIISDGVNRPWKVTSAMTASPLTGAYLTDVSGAWYGPPVVYYGKLFGIQVSDRLTIEWSEENDADNGYETDGSNVWELTQSDPDPLNCLHATNDALYYFRGESIGAIRGAVTTDFQTNGVHDGVSNTVGTLSPASVVSAGKYVYFADQKGRPCRIVQGGGVEQIWQAASESLGLGVNSTEAAHISAAYDPETGTIVFAHPVNASTALNLFVFDAESGRYLGQWAYPTGFSTSQFRALGVQLYLNEGVRTLHVLDQLGNLFGLVPKVLSVYADNAGSDLDVSHQLTVAPMGYEPEAQKQFDLLHANIRSVASPSTQTHSASYRVPSSTAYSTAQNVTKTGTSAGLSQKFSWGLNALGRWLNPKITNSSQIQSGYLDVSVEAALVDERPGAS